MYKYNYDIRKLLYQYYAIREIKYTMKVLVLNVFIPS